MYLFLDTFFLSFVEVKENMETTAGRSHGRHFLSLPNILEHFSQGQNFAGCI